MISRTRVALLAALALLLVVSVLPAAADPLPSSSSTPAAITTGGSVDVTLTLEGETNVESTPTDIIFVIDESGSINGSEFGQLRQFLQSLNQSLTEQGLYLNGGSVGIVGFASGVRTILPPSRSSATVSSVIAGITQTNGSTCNGCGLERANLLLNGISGASLHNKIIVQLTDGVSNQLPSVQTVLETTNVGQKTRFAIGVGNAVNQAELNLIASDPDSDFVFNVNDFNALAAATEGIVEAVVVPGATGVTVAISPAAGFTFAPGSAATASGTFDEGSLTWSIDELGDETVSLSYALNSVPGACGDLPLHDAITYADTEGGVVAFDLLSATVTGCLVADAGPDQVVEQTSPAGADVTLDGTGSGPGAGALSFSWDFGGLTGPTPTATFPAGTTTVTLTVTDGVETRTDTVDITVQDTTDPILTFTGGGTYALVDPVAVDCTATDDPGSGVADGCDEADASGPAWTFGAGTTTLSADATDNAGNTATGSTDVVVEVDVDGLCALVKDFNAKDNGQERAMCQKLEKGNFDAFRNHVSAQSGKAFTTEQADLLIALSELLG